MPRDLAVYISAGAFGVVVAATALTQQFGPISTPEAAAALERVAVAIDTLPYLHGTLVGVDSTPLAAARRMLRPLRLIQRTYSDTESADRFSIVVVCSPDARDLAGHHPPVCYPSAGWVALGSVEASVPTGDRTVPAVSYRFERVVDETDAIVRTVATSFFIVPGNEQPFQSSMRAVEAAARDRRAAGMGAVHVMITLEGDPDAAERARLLGRAGAVLSPMIDRIAH